MKNIWTLSNVMVLIGTVLLIGAFANMFYVHNYAIAVFMMISAFINFRDSVRIRYKETTKIEEMK